MAEWPINDATSKVFPLYSRANVGEIFPDPISPLNASVGFQHGLEPGWRDAFVACGVWDKDLYDETVPMNILPAFGSYLYINMSLMRLFGVRVPGMSAEAVDLQYFGDMPGIPSYESERRDFDENAEYEAKAGQWLGEQVLGATDLAAYDADRVEVERIRAERPDLATLSDAELFSRMRSFETLLRRLFKHHIEASLKSGVGLGAMAQLTEAIGRPELALTLVAGIGNIDSALPSIRMWNLGRLAQKPQIAELFDAGVAELYERLSASDDSDVVAFTRELDDFLTDWDFRGPAEWEIRATTWGVNPALALGTIDRMRHVDESEAPETKTAERASQREAASALVREALAAEAEASGQFEAVLNAAALWMRGRERGRTTAAMLMHEIRLAALELGRRGVAAGSLIEVKHIFMLFADEIDTYLSAPATLTSTLADRERTYLDLFDRQPPFVVDGTAPPVEEWPLRADRRSTLLGQGESIVGVSGCTGIARGRARVLLSPDDPSALEAGDILVAPITDPSWTPLFVTAAAVVVDVGAPFSHAAIVSRELGIPCIVSATDATVRIADGAQIEVDGSTGTVTVL
ncbi:phosphoenolpyruvate-utilizing protein [Rhodococcus sp. 06-156-3C]|uniref:PEP-utilizing enzyme n=1 Tax=Nocardiaceae TaxID=85025 RepID=UPI000522FECA|nr:MULTISPECIES: PEP-utilizing enzyme [Rhodococcus]OZD11127.1 phosphoenolpyruvate-utilizing protein [Rhodococcus sp. 06-156-4C]OZD14543.1 phosphoenolpyruvate-utilizing protein [Rhodococcus sp. 06-156-4a]OZD24877.1 phosphoenolpyruvate-utilizing protein [Rhodococcus sp. 06-156-3C]OZD27851.1 phosphoenolpyruvate-utilizing protein [Rhodococcus sp. 06-156-3b]OZD39833.1 phosphoenolpyruvate-utilizing protein [Rhodococcus sp. 06-156-3]